MRTYIVLTVLVILFQVKMVDLFVKFILSLLIITMPTTAMAQSKFYSTPSRGGAEGAKQNAQLQALIQENAERIAETAANEASITTLRDATEGSLTTISDCGTQGTLFGPGHALADGNDCIPSLKVANDGNVLFQGGAKFGTSALCDPTAEGTIRYNVSVKRMEFCNGEVWASFNSNQPTGIEVVRCREPYYGEVPACPVGGPNPGTCCGNFTPWPGPNGYGALPTIYFQLKCPTGKRLIHWSPVCRQHNIGQTVPLYGYYVGASLTSQYDLHVYCSSSGYNGGGSQITCAD